MGAFLAALAAAGDAGVQSMNQNIEQQNRSDLENQRSENENARDISRSKLEEQKMIAIADHAESIKNAPLQRLGIIAQRQMQQDVPQEAAPVTQISGNDSSSDFNQGGSANADGKGLVGMTRAQVSAYKDPDMLAQYDRQMQSDNQDAQDAVADKTRKRTSDEAIDATLSEMKINDPVSYAAVMTSGIVPSKIVKLGKDETLWDSANKKILFANTAGEDKDMAMKSMEINSKEKIADNENKVKLAIANLNDKDPAFIKELKNLYPTDSQEYQDALMARIGKESGVNGGAGGRAVVFNARVIGAANQALHAVQNIVDLPMGSTSGWLGGYQPGHSLLGANMAVMKNHLNDQDVQTYNVMKLGLSRSLAAMETQGLSPSGSLVSSLDKMDFSTGDTGMTTLRKIAEAKQIAVSALEQKLNDPSVPGEQRQFVQKLIDGFNTAVPYDHHDLTALQKAQDANPQMTFSDLANAKLHNGTPIPGPATQAKPANNGITFLGFE